MNKKKRKNKYLFIKIVIEKFNKIKKIVKKTTFKKNLIFFILSVFVGFISNYIWWSLKAKNENKKTQTTILYQISKSEERIKEKVTLDEKVSLALELYKNEEKNRFNEFVQDIFPRLKTKLSVDVASLFFFKEDYINASKEIIEQDRLNPSWDYSLWKDLAFCLRKYSQKYSVTAESSLLMI